MALEIPTKFLLPEKFDPIHFDYQSESTSTPSTPSTPCSPGEPYAVLPIEHEDHEAVLNHLRTFFFRDEPLNLDIRLLEDENDRCRELEDYAMDEFDNGLNLKAVSNGKIIGVCLNGIAVRDHKLEKDEDCKNEKFAKILKLLAHVGVESDIFKFFPDCDKAMTVKIISVDNTCRGRGVAKELMNKTRELGKKLGCGFMAVDCSSHFTAKALKKLGFECIYRLNYADYKVNDKVVFKPQPPHEAITVYAKRID